MNAQSKATAKYKTQNVKRYALEVNKTTEKDLYDEIERQPNKSKYLKDLIKEKIGENLGKA